MNAEKTGNLIASRRREKGMTQKELSELLHVTDRAVSKWERGLSFPDVSLLESLCDVLGLTLTELMTGRLQEFPPEQSEQPLREMLDLSKAVLRKRTVKLRLAAAAACILALVLLGIGGYRLWNAPFRPAAANTLKQLALTESSQTIAALSNDAVCRYRYTLTGDVQEVRAVYEVWTEEGKADEDVLWHRDENELPLTRRGTFCFSTDLTGTFAFDGIAPADPHMKMSWLYPAAAVIEQPIPLPWEASGVVLMQPYNGPRRVEGDSVLLQVMSFKMTDSYRASEDEELQRCVSEARRGDPLPVPAGGYTVAIWLELQRAV